MCASGPNDHVVYDEAHQASTTAREAFGMVGSDAMTVLRLRGMQHYVQGAQRALGADAGLLLVLLNSLSVNIEGWEHIVPATTNPCTVHQQHSHRCLCDMHNAGTLLLLHRPAQGDCYRSMQSLLDACGLKRPHADPTQGPTACMDRTSLHHDWERQCPLEVRPIFPDILYSYLRIFSKKICNSFISFCNS